MLCMLYVSILLEHGDREEVNDLTRRVMFNLRNYKIMCTTSFPIRATTNHATIQSPQQYCMNSLNFKVPHHVIFFVSLLLPLLLPNILLSYFLFRQFLYYWIIKVKGTWILHRS